MARFLMMLLCLSIACIETYSRSFADETIHKPDSTQVRLLVPAYFYPAGEGLKTWNRLIESHNPKKQIEIVAIANINSGNVGTELDPNYADVIRRSAKKGLTVIAYITSDYANKNGNAPLEKAKTNVTNWFKLYPELHGVFVDEQTSDAAMIESYYLPLRWHINSTKPNAFVIGNPGNNCVEDFVVKRPKVRKQSADTAPLRGEVHAEPPRAVTQGSKGSAGALPSLDRASQAVSSKSFEGPVMDVVIIHENNETKLPYSTVSPAPWMSAYSANRFAMLVHTSDTFIPQLDLAKTNRTGFVYVTDATGPPPDSIHPWGTLTTYWDAELKHISEQNDPAKKRR